MVTFIHSWNSGRQSCPEPACPIEHLRPKLRGQGLRLADRAETAGALGGGYDMQELLSGLW